MSEGSSIDDFGLEVKHLRHSLGLDTWREGTASLGIWREMWARDFLMDPGI